MHSKHIFLASITMFAGAASLQAQAQFIPMPSEITNLRDITPDGAIIVGTGTDPSTGSASGFYWRWQTDPSPNFIGGRSAVAVSDDGDVIVGDMDDPTTGAEVAGRWTTTTGWTALGGLVGSCGSTSSAYDVSDDGETVVGLAWVNCSARGFRWTQATGMVELQSLANGNNRASAISGNGAVIGGFAQGTFNRTAATWDSSTDLGTLYDVNSVGEVYGISEDGSVVLGAYDDEAFFATADTGLVKFGSLNSGWTGAANGVNRSRTRICGLDILGLGQEAWVWEPSTGIVSLQSRLTQLGVAGVPSLGRCSAMTADGSIIVGATFFQGAWIAILPSAEAEVYGCGLNPAGSMQVSGVPTLGSVVTLGLDNPLGTQSPGSGTLLIVSFAPQANFPCGLPTFDGSMTPGQPGELLVNLPAFFIPGLPWAGTGTPANFPIPIPTTPSTLIGLSIYCQGAILDASTGINGLTEAARLEIGIY